MAFQLSALIVQGDYTEDPAAVFERLGFPRGVAAGTVSFVEATSPQPSTRTIGSNGEWTMITDSMPFVSYSRTAPVGSLWAREVSQFLKECSEDGKRAFGFIMSNLSSNYGFSLYQDGEHVRSLLAQMGNILVSEGRALKLENRVADTEDKELAIFRLMEELEIPFHDFEAAQFHYFAFERND
jgi:hypothetical protein